jgi:hypothetical protein
MEPEGSLPYSQQPTTGPYLKSDDPVHTIPPYFLIHSNIILPSTYKPSGWSFP